VLKSFDFDYECEGGACGYGTMVDVKPFRARVGAVGPLLFMKGEGCGACYKVKCLDKSICSRRAVTVIITDECPGCPSDQTHFDLSGAAFGRMAIAGENGPLRDRGQIPVIYRRYVFQTSMFNVPCVCCVFHHYYSDTIYGLLDDFTVSIWFRRERNILLGW